MWKSDLIEANGIFNINYSNAWLNPDLVLCVQILPACKHTREQHFCAGYVSRSFLELSDPLSTAAMYITMAVSLMLIMFHISVINA